MPLKVDASQLRAFGKKLREIDPDVYKQMRGEIKDQGKVVAADAAARAAWSTRIPETIRPSILNNTTLVIRAGNPKTAPHAKPIEHGGKQGTFRHPVFADERGERDVRTRGAASRIARRVENKITGVEDWVWVEQKANPFVHPAVIAHLQETAEAIGAAVVKAANAAARKVSGG